MATTSKKLCCVNCFQDGFLLAYLKEHGSPGSCTFCKKKSKYCFDPADLLDLLALPEETRLEIADAIVLLESGRRLEMPLSRSLSGIRPGLHELRIRDKSGQVRVIYYIKKEDAIYFIHGFRKKTRTIPRRELDIINKRLKEV